MRPVNRRIRGPGVDDEAITLRLKPGHFRWVRLHADELLDLVSAQRNALIRTMNVDESRVKSQNGKYVNTVCLV